MFFHKFIGSKCQLKKAGYTSYMRLECEQVWHLGKAAAKASMQLVTYLMKQLRLHM